MNEECDYCSNNTEVYLSGGDGVIIDKRMGVYIFAEHYRGEIVRITNINYCPKCGKKLKL